MKGDLVATSERSVRLPIWGVSQGSRRATQGIWRACCLCRIRYDWSFHQCRRSIRITENGQQADRRGSDSSILFLTTYLMLQKVNINELHSTRVWQKLDDFQR